MRLHTPSVEGVRRLVLVVKSRIRYAGTAPVFRLNSYTDVDVMVVVSLGDACIP